MSLCDLVSSKIIVIPTIIFTIKREEVLILRITNMPKLLVLFHVILVNTCYSVFLFQVPGGKYIIDIFSDDVASTSPAALLFIYRDPKGASHISQSV